MRPILILLGLFYLCPSLLPAQPRPVFEQLVPNADLSASEITGLLQDDAGYLWIATIQGLNRFDGRNVKQYFYAPSQPTSISDNILTRNTILKHGRHIWIGTNRGLSRYNPDSDDFTRFMHDPADPTSLCHPRVLSIIAIDPSTFWIGTEIGLCHFDLESGQFTLYQPYEALPTENSDAILSLVPGDAGDLWAGTGDGLLHFDIASKLFNPYPLSDEIHAHFRGSNDNTNNPIYINDILREDRILWLGTHDGLVRLDLDTGDQQLFSIPSESSSRDPFFVINDLMIDSKNRLWVGTTQAGPCQFFRASASFECFPHQANDPATPAHNIVISLLEDYEGHIWAGTWNGVSKMIKNLGFQHLTHDPENPAFSLSSPRVRAIYEEPDGTLLIGTDHGLNKVDPVTKSIRKYYYNDHPDSLSNSSIWSIAPKGDSTWLATAHHFNIWDRKNDVFRELPADSTTGLQYNSNYTVFIDSQGDLWGATHFGGLSHLVDPVAIKFKTYLPSPENEHSISSDIVWPIFEYPDGVIWAGTLGGGLNKFNPENERFKVFRPDTSQTSISGSNVLTIAADGLGTMWLGMQTTGLNRFNPETEEFHVFTEADGLADDEVLCILPEGDERLWIATRNGLSVYSLQEEPGTFLNLYKQNGLPSSMFIANACHLSASGMFRFGTENGMVSFFPENLDLDMPPPRLAITDFQINNQEHHLDPSNDARHFDHTQNRLGFRVAALSYTVPDKNTFTYRLEGYETEWNDLGTDDFITYTNLPAGDYTLEVIGRNSAGIPATAPLRYAFTMGAPFYQTTWFQILALALILLVGVIVYRMRVAALIRTARKELEFNMKLARLRNEIAADFHDNIGSGLGSLGLEIDLFIHSEASLQERIKEKLQHFRDRLNHISETRRDMTWVIDPSHDRFEDLADRLRDAAYAIVPEGKLAINIPESLPVLHLTMKTRRMLLFLVKEALYNAVKHADASQISLEIHITANRCVFEITDNGIGFDPATVHRGDGLGNMHRRAEEIGGELTITGAAGEGTRVRLTINMEDSSHRNAR